MDSISITQSPIKLPNKLLIKLQSKSPNKLGAGFFISAPKLLFILYLSWHWLNFFNW